MAILTIRETHLATSQQNSPTVATSLTFALPTATASEAGTTMFIDQAAQTQLSKMFLVRKSVPTVGSIPYSKPALIHPSVASSIADPPWGH